MEKVIVLPATEAQIPLIVKLKNRGYIVVAINPEETSGTDCANLYEKGDILDKERCVDIARKHVVKAVFTDQCDIAVPTVAYINSKLGLHGIGEDLAALYTNKFLMREFAKEHNIPCPEYQKCSSIEEAENFFGSLKYSKMIMKPIDSNSSRGVFTITKKQDIEKYFHQSLEYSKVDSAVLCEEYIEGTEFTVDGIVINGVHYSLAVSRKKHFTFNENIAYELYFSYQDSQYDYEELRRQNDKYVTLTNLPFGFTHAEYKYNGTNYIQIEIGARGGGNYISSHIVPALTGIDMYDLLIDSTLSVIHKEKFLPHRENQPYAILKFFDIHGQNGKVVSIEGEDFLKNCPEVILYQFRVVPGERVQQVFNDSMRVGFYIAVVPTKQKLDELTIEIENKIKILLEE